MLFFILLWLVTADTTLSQTVESLPGFPGKLPLKLETGYVGVGHLQTVQLFYYFVESETNPEDDPLVLWLNGGPGCSGLSAIFYEIGPLSFDYTKSSSHPSLPVLKLNSYSWTKVANVIFIDAPVGTGFSYATQQEEYIVNDSKSAAQTYEFLKKVINPKRIKKVNFLPADLWLLSHPQFLKNKLYIAGDSYSGIILPIVVQMISDGNEAGHEPHMNIQGYSLGNPITDESVDKNWQIPFAHRMGLISDKLYESTKEHCKGDYVTVDPGNAACLTDLLTVTECTKMIYTGQILEPTCAYQFPKPTGLLQPLLSIWNPKNMTEDYLDLLRQRLGLWCRTYNYVFSYTWANTEEVQTALHVRKGTVKEWMRCTTAALSETYTKDVTCSVPFHKNLIKGGYRVLIYSGDHDMNVPYIGTLHWIKSLNLTLYNPWKPWYVNGQVGGYTLGYTNKKYNLVYSTVKGAGHTAPEYKPKESFAMISRWIAGFPL